MLYSAVSLSRADLQFSAVSRASEVHFVLKPAVWLFLSASDNHHLDIDRLDLCNDHTKRLSVPLKMQPSERAVQQQLRVAKEVTYWCILHRRHNDDSIDLSVHL